MAAALRAGLRRCRPAASPPEFGGREAATTARLPIAAECREVRPAGGEERGHSNTTFVSNSSQDKIFAILLASIHSPTLFPTTHKMFAPFSQEYELKLGFKPATSLQPKSAYLVT
uniref:OSJNBa0028M15.4 protein n=1 Tax=Oryza sativa subsp. japonica TaxID=39947 RepID=Q7FA45_ORYSJ|nr:OSJNBa0028M15.4 [Oryza sativa Japonica Group]